jgi:hypothetical protein
LNASLKAADAKRLIRMDNNIYYYYILLLFFRPRFCQLNVPNGVGRQRPATHTPVPWTSLLWWAIWTPLSFTQSWETSPKISNLNPQKPLSVICIDNERGLRPTRFIHALSLRLCRPASLKQATPPPPVFLEICEFSCSSSCLT